MRSIRFRLALGCIAAALLACGDSIQIDYASPTADWPGFGGGLPALSGAIPATYRLTEASKQFVVVATGMGAGPQELLAFALRGTD